MNIIHFGIKTESGSNYLIEEQVHTVGHSTWFLYEKGQKYQISFLMSNSFYVSLRVRDIASVIHKLREFAKLSHESTAAWTSKNLGSGKSIVPPKYIRSISEFRNHRIVCADFEVSELSDFARLNLHINTSSVIEYFEFK